MVSGKKKCTFSIFCSKWVLLLNFLMWCHSVSHPSCSSGMQLWRVCVRVCFSMWRFVAVCPLVHECIHACVHGLGGRKWSWCDVSLSLIEFSRWCDLHLLSSVCTRVYVRVAGWSRAAKKAWRQNRVVSMAIWRPAGMRIGNWSQMNTEMKLVLSKRKPWWR